MARLAKPHGAPELRPRLISADASHQVRARAATLPRLPMRSREVGDLIMIGIGGFTPLEGFMTRADWAGVCNEMTTASGLFWPIPITLSIDRTTAGSLKEGTEVTLVDGDTNEIMATMVVTEKYTIDKAHECATVFGTTDCDHPGVQMVMAQGEVNLAGPVKVLSQGQFPQKYPQLYLTP
ncbi:MAG: sulfate adenylyltransferase, partial [Acidiferrobacterales bacterium]